MGELYLSKFVALSTQDAERGSIAAAGWGGDQLAVWSTVDRRRDHGRHLADRIR